MSEFGFVYILGNKAMPGIYKIGMSSRSPFARCKELSSATSCPMPFSVLAFIGVEFPAEEEKEIHEELNKYRVNSSREFFKCDIYDALIALWARSSHGYYVNGPLRRELGIHDSFLEPTQWEESKRRSAKRKGDAK